MGARFMRSARTRIWTGEDRPCRQRANPATMASCSSGVARAKLTVPHDTIAAEPRPPRSMNSSPAGATILSSGYSGDRLWALGRHTSSPSSAPS